MTNKHRKSLTDARAEFKRSRGNQVEFTGVRRVSHGVWWALQLPEEELEWLRRAIRREKGELKPESEYAEPIPDLPKVH